MQLALKLALGKRSESDGRNNNEQKESGSEEGEETEMGDLGLSGRRRDGEQGSQSAGRSRDETELVERSDSQGATGLNVARNNARSSLHPQLLHVTTKNRQTSDCHAKLDSGADDNFISITQLRKLGYDKEDLTPSQHTWNAFGNRNLSSLGSLELTWTTDNRTEPRQPVKFYVLDDTFKELVLGHAFSFKEGLLIYDRTAWTLMRNKTMSPEQRDGLRHANKGQAGQNLAGRGVHWECEAATGRYFFIDAAGRTVYQNEGGPTGGSGSSGAQGQNSGGSSR
jgi:hypothetical protein